MTVRFCVDCEHYHKPFFKPAVCRRVLERDPVTGKTTKTYEKEVREAREKDCKGAHYAFDWSFF